MNKNRASEKSVGKKGKSVGQRSRRISSFLAALLFVFSTAIAAFLPLSGTASAAGMLDDAPLETQALSYTYFSGLYWCLENSGSSPATQD
mgnify:CR=1 FL=1